MIFSSRRFLQKTNERILLYYYETSGWLVFVHFFWRKLKTPKRHFKIILPLVIKYSTFLDTWHGLFSKEFFITSSFLLTLGLLALIEDRAKSSKLKSLNFVTISRIRFWRIDHCSYIYDFYKCRVDMTCSQHSFFVCVCLCKDLCINGRNTPKISFFEITR